MSDFYLVVDLEATCWENDPEQPEKSEIIEIGAVLWDSRQKEVLNEFQSFVQPVRHPLLSTFCTSLTSIKQTQVADAPLYPEVMQSLHKKILEKYQVVLSSWGAYDRKQLQHDCEFHKVTFPFSEEHLNIKQMFAACFGCKPCGMLHALDMLGLPLAGIHHRGIDDARNIARILTACSVAHNPQLYVKKWASGRNRA